MHTKFPEEKTKTADLGSFILNTKPGKVFGLYSVLGLVLATGCVPSIENKSEADLDRELKERNYSLSSHINGLAVYGNQPVGKRLTYKEFTDITGIEKSFLYLSYAKRISGFEKYFSFC